MKAILRYGGLLVCSLFTAGLLYPALHEGGHAAAALLLGGRVHSLALLPAPVTVCEFAGFYPPQQIVVGLAGMGLPLVFSGLLFCRRFWLWYTGALLSFINLLALSLGIVSVFYPLPNEDAARVLALWPAGRPVFLLGFALLFVLLLAALVCSRPLRRVTDYFLPPAGGV